MFLTIMLKQDRYLQRQFKATCVPQINLAMMLGSSEFDDNLSVFCCLHGDAEDDLSAI